MLQTHSENIVLTIIDVTLVTSQQEMFPLNDFFPEKRLLISVTAEVSKQFISSFPARYELTVILRLLSVTLNLDSQTFSQDEPTLNITSRIRTETNISPIEMKCYYLIYFLYLKYS